MSAPVREELVSSAVAFLQDPVTANSPLAQRIAFLEAKGMTAREIEVSLQQAGSTSSYAAPSQQAVYPSRPPYYAQAVQPTPPARDYRDVFIAATVFGGIGYVAVSLVRVCITHILCLLLDSQSASP